MKRALVAMPVLQACPVTVTGAIGRVLTRRARGLTTSYRDKIRAQIVLLAARRWSNAVIAAEVGISVDTVRTWRGRFAAQGLAGLADRARSDRPTRFTPVQVAQVKALACQLPVHASWVNQVEVYFSVVQRKVVSPNDFTDLTEVEQRLADFEKRYNATAQPFQWKFTRRDLHDLLTRISEHERQDAPAERQHAA